MNRAMDKRSRKEILTRILEVLRHTEGLTINELAKETDSNWSTIRLNLDILKKLKRVKEEKTSKGTIISLSTFELTDTLFSLPISKKGENYSKFLFRNIKEIWIRETGKSLERTRAHKIAVKVANTLDLPAPRGWYMYGELMVQQFYNGEDYSPDFQPENKTKILKQIKTVVIESKSKTITQLKTEQYKSNKLYSAANQLSKLLSTSKLERVDCLEIKESLYEVLFKLRITPRHKELLELVNDFGSLLMLLLKSKRDLTKTRADILSAWNAIWNLIALMNFYDSLAERKFELYTPELLDKYLSIAFETSKLNAEDQLFALRDLIDFPKVKKTPISKYKGIAKPQSHSAI